MEKFWASLLGLATNTWAPVEERSDLHDFVYILAVKQMC